MKIRTKLFLALSALPLLLIILIVSGVFQNSYLNRMNENIETKHEASILAGKIRADIKDQGIRLRNLLIFQDETAIQEEISAIRLKSEGIQNNIHLLKNTIINNDQKELIDALEVANNDFINYREQVIYFIQQEDVQAAKGLIDENSASIQNQFNTTITEITALMETDLGVTLDDWIHNTKTEIIINIIILALAIIVIFSVQLNSILSLTRRLNGMSETMSGISNGNLDLSNQVQVNGNDEIDHVALSFNQMSETLSKQIQKEQDETWIQTNISEITKALSGSHNLKEFGHTFLSMVVPLLESSQAVFYIKDLDQAEPVYKMISKYAFEENKYLKKTVRLGEGLIGQAVLEKSPVQLKSVPEEYLSIVSGLGSAAPANIHVLPIIFDGDVKAVLEIASFKPYSSTQESLLNEIIDGLGIVVESVMGRIQLAKVLKETQTLMEEIQAQSEELQNQQEELRATNEELEEQTQSLLQSEEKLQRQQEELEEINADLEEKAKTLEEQNRQLELANQNIEEARVELETKAEQLTLSSKYKSEFLANMSHELRTPLNSLIILSKLLTENKDGNLTAKQMEYSRTIYSSSKDLLILINDILDLAKIESGKINLNLGEVRISQITEFVETSFRYLAEEKGLNFTIHLDENLPESIHSDEVRIQQVLKNLLANAFKFTEQGEVRFEIRKSCDLNGKQEVAFAIRDTGIGISNDNLQIIFEAFQQADGTTSRKYGGTGLGLSISREIADLVGGEITVESIEGKGSTFTFLVGDYQKHESIQVGYSQFEAAATVEPQKSPVSELKYAKEAIEITNDVRTTEKGLVTNPIKKLLLIDDDTNQRNSIMELIGDMDIIIKGVSTGREALEQLKINNFDCMILDLGLADTDGIKILEQLRESELQQDCKVYIYTGRELSSKEEFELNKYTHTIIIKNEHSPERLKAELELFLKDSNEQLNSETDGVTDNSRISDLVGKKILLADDDVRNVFALSSVLESGGMEVIFAEDGRESIEVLENNPDIDLVLMDIMMPEMDGFEAIQIIREKPQYKELPIIAVTAKAMKEDREKCLEVGASDYLAKPVEPDQLISLIKVWLYPQKGGK